MLSSRSDKGFGPIIMSVMPVALPARMARLAENDREIIVVQRRRRNGAGTPDAL